MEAAVVDKLKEEKEDFEKQDWHKHSMLLHSLSTQYSSYLGNYCFPDMHLVSKSATNYAHGRQHSGT